MNDNLHQELGRNIPLKEMITSLREELSAAIAEGESQALKFHVPEVELELNLTLSKTTEGSGGLKFWVITAEGKHAVETSQVHKFKLKLKPEFRGGRTQVSSDKLKSPPK